MEAKREDARAEGTWNACLLLVALRVRTLRYLPERAENAIVQQAMLKARTFRRVRACDFIGLAIALFLSGRRPLSL